jgi:hypothetical protein
MLDSITVKIAPRHQLTLGKLPLHECYCILAGAHASFELCVFNGGEHLAEPGPGTVSHSDKVPTVQQQPRAHLFFRRVLQVFAHEFVPRQVAVAAEAIDAM